MDKTKRDSRSEKGGVCLIKEKIGIVVSDKMAKTRVVRVERLVRHSKYQKILKVRKKFYAHDEKNESKEGQRVRIQETRPTSSLKRWKVVQIYA